MTIFVILDIIIERSDNMNVELSELTIRILFLFFPGIIDTIIIEKITSHKKHNSFDFIIRAFIYGIISYFILYCFANFLNRLIEILGRTLFGSYSDPHLFNITSVDCLINGSSVIDFKEIICATVIGIIFSLIISALVNYRILYKLAKILGISEELGGVDLWDNLFNGMFHNNTSFYIRIRDLKYNLIYDGEPLIYSANHIENEICLQNVTVYLNDLNGDDPVELYKVDYFYFSKFDDNIRIEIKRFEEEVR